MVVKTEENKSLTKRKAGRPRSHEYTEAEQAFSERRKRNREIDKLTPKSTVPLEEVNSAIADFTLTCMAIAKNADKRDPETLMNCLQQYVAECNRRGLKMSNLMCYLACGVTRQNIDWWYQKKVYANDERYYKFACLCKALCGASREQLALEGKINPVFAIWQQKCHDGFREDDMIAIAEEQERHKTTEEIMAEFADI